LLLYKFLNFSRIKQETATPLGTTFSTDEQVVAQGDVTYTRKVVESLVMKFDQAKYEEFLSSSSKNSKARQYRKVSLGTHSRVPSEIPSDTTGAKSAMANHITRKVATMSPMRPARSAWLTFSPLTPVLLLSSKLPGVLNNPYGVTKR